MVELCNIGLSEEEIYDLVLTNPEIVDIDILKYIDILKTIGCTNSIIKHIIVSNPFYLSRDINEIKDLILKLQDLGITHLEITFDTNPYLLNKDVLEIDNYIEEQLTLGYSIEDIIDNIDFGNIN